MTAGRSCAAAARAAVTNLLSKGVYAEFFPIHDALQDPSSKKPNLRCGRRRGTRRPPLARPG